MENYKRKIKYVFVESILASGAIGIAIPIMTVFWNSIGMNQAMIGISQMACTLAIIFLDIPMGYIADRYNRKVLNIIGDFGLAFTFIFYMNATNFWYVLLGEILCGFFVAMTNGVDNSFMKFYSDKIDSSGKLFEKNNAKLRSNQFISLVVAIFIGMIVSKYSIKACIGLIAIPLILSGICATFVDDIGEKDESKVNKIKGMYINTKKILKKKELKWLIIANGVTSEFSHAIIWVLTPLLLMVGVPVYIVGIGWILNYITPIIGSYIARVFYKYKIQNKFILSFLTFAVPSIIIYFVPNVFTVWLFALTGLARGFSGVLITPLIQKRTEDKYQTTVLSITSTISRMMYIPLVYLVNLFSNNAPQLALLVNLLIFLPFVIIIYIKLRKYRELNL